jgi:alpha-galactosidase
MDCKITLKNDQLTLENSRIRRRYQWNGGSLIGLNIEDRFSGKIWDLDGETPDCTFPDLPVEATDGKLEISESPANSITPEHLRAKITLRLGNLEVKRIFRLYPDCPAIACDYYLRGSMEDEAEREEGDLSNIEDPRKLNRTDTDDAILERLCLPDLHYRLTAVQFFDITDRNNNLVHLQSILPYRHESRLPGNLLFIEPQLEEGGLFILKEAPCSSVQLSYPGFDFACRIGRIDLVGFGVSADDLVETEWTRAYGFVTGVTPPGELGRLDALRTYQEKIRRHLPERDEMVLMNTWGDRNQDSRIGEPFALAELEAGSRLGVSHLQLDDGWQAGRSSNSAFGGGSLVDIWDNPDYWTPHPERFPNGLAPVVNRGHELGIEVCIWFNPSKDDSYSHWRDDADRLIRLNREHGIRTFKIDGVQVPDKRAETNLRRMFDAVIEATSGDVVFNLDVTAGQRYGYHYFNEYGNIFLENRYTDWPNYYPHWSLRNLWMLSRFVPAQNLQIEFLNSWRNAEKYPDDDPLAPSRVPFDYIFAITMMAQPLAWFESTGLPEDAFAIAPLIRTYRDHQVRIHAGRIFPIGDEPCGTGWTGFQSISGKNGYILVFRELNEQSNANVRTFNSPGSRIECRSLCGHGKRFTATVDEQGRLPFALAAPFSFALYEYSTI